MYVVQFKKVNSKRGFGRRDEEFKVMNYEKVLLHLKGDSVVNIFSVGKEDIKEKFLPDVKEMKIQKLKSKIEELNNKLKQLKDE